VRDWRELEAINQTIMREMNEWTEQDYDQRLGSERPLDVYLGECSDRRCTEPITLSRGEYEAIREGATRFAIALHHENPEIDRVVFETVRYAAVEKFYGAPARIARDSDPRR